DKCDLCGECAEVCPSRAIEIAGRQVSVEDVMKEVEKDLVFHDESGGGVTFSGGEPLMQPGFLQALLEGAKKRGMHAVVDTCGSAQPAVLDRIGDKVDLFLYDLKVLDDEKHRRFTGDSNKIVLENLRKLDKGGKAIVVRIPIIPGVNDGEKDIREMLGFLQSLENSHRLSLLPYHDLGKEKYRRFTLPYKIGSIQAPSRELIERIKKRMQSSGFEVTVGG
ncbi:MAG: glycyl-radical enzyme activating protein, partial [Candidatus Aminicenantes bacterium]|nr:glycyl-radical enzyme activating protein [Candidatus Aminicenantes bacterium]